MIVLDAFAVIALLWGEPAAPTVERLLNGGDAALTTVGLTEVADRLVRVAGASEEEAALDLAQLDLLDAVIVDEDLGLAAGLLRARHYHRRTRAVSLADCLAAEASRRHRATLATADPHLLDLCLDEGIATHPLADSTGTTWSP